MVSSSKILTVSYGTFSCTAEGFDDPLAVVKDTTHFFRGVIREDRFFGAEPPSFDPELASEMMREQLAADHGAGTLSLGTSAISSGASSSGALAAALSAGPARPRPKAEPPASLPDDDTIEAAAVLTETSGDDADETDQNGADATPGDDTATDAPEQVAERVADPVEAVETSEPVHPTLHDITEDEEPAPLLSDVASHDAPATPAAPSLSDTAKAPDVSASRTEPRSEPDPDDADASPEVADSSADLPSAVLAMSGLDSAEPVKEAPVSRFSDPLGVAAKLRRIRAVVAGQATETAAAEQPEAPAPTAADTQVDDAHSDPVDSATERASEEDMLAALASDITDEGEDRSEPSNGQADDDGIDDAALDALIGTLESDLDKAPDTYGPETLAEGIDTLTSDAEVDDEPEDDHLFADSIASMMAMESGPMTSGQTGAVPEIGEGSGEALSLSDDDADEEELAFDEDEADDAEAPSDSLAAEHEAAALDTDEWDTPDEHASQPEPARTGPVAQTPIRARVVKVKRAEFEKAVASGELEEVTEDDVAPMVAQLQDHEDSSLSPEEEDELARELAAVKAELSGGLAAWNAADEEQGAEDETAQDPAPLRLDNPLPSDDRDWTADQDALDEETDAAATTEPAASEAEEMVRDSARKAVKMASPARALLTERDVEDDDTSRLLDQTNSEMDEPEGNRRRSAIAHLRAAVAATKADRLLGRQSEPEDEQEPYREDLASVVRPRRPQTSGARTDRPTEPAPAPLKLVAAQRVNAGPASGEAADATGEAAQDATAPTPRVTPVRPRRVRRAAQSPSSRDIPAPQPLSGLGDAEGFAAYASSMGAVDLPDLLEAAAAYMSYVEGRDQFSRPQLMTTVRQAELSESSREDRLRSFGQLLREGKIQKTSGGRFTASERISFKPELAAG